MWEPEAYLQATVPDQVHQHREGRLPHDADRVQSWPLDIVWERLFHGLGVWLLYWPQPAQQALLTPARSISRTLLQESTARPSVGMPQIIGACSPAQADVLSLGG